MAYDAKRLQTFKWLEKLSHNEAPYLKKIKDFINPIQDICVYCGSIYATNDIILAKINYPEFEHLSDWEWSKVVAYTDDDNMLLEFPKLALRNKQFLNDRIFDDAFPGSWNNACYTCFDPRVMKDALKPFEINRINPELTTERDRVMFSGHNKDVSMRVLMMGVR